MQHYVSALVVIVHVLSKESYSAVVPDVSKNKIAHIQVVESCPEVGYYQEESSEGCHLCFCQDNTTALCWDRGETKCTNNFTLEGNTHHRVRRSPFGLSDIFFKDAAKEFFNKQEPNECQPFESSYSEGCPPEDWCIGCTVCDCNANGHWECHVLSFCADKDKNFNGTFTPKRKRLSKSKEKVMIGKSKHKNTKTKSKEKGNMNRSIKLKKNQYIAPKNRHHSKHPIEIPKISKKPKSKLSTGKTKANLSKVKSKPNLKENPKANVPKGKTKPNISRAKLKPNVWKAKPKPNLSKAKPKPSLSKTKPKPNLSRAKPKSNVSKEKPKPSTSTRKPKRDVSAKKPESKVTTKKPATKQKLTSKPGSFKIKKGLNNNNTVKFAKMIIKKVFATIGKAKQKLNTTAQVNKNKIMLKQTKNKINNASVKNNNNTVKNPVSKRNKRYINKSEIGVNESNQQNKTNKSFWNAAVMPSVNGNSDKDINISNNTRYIDTTTTSTMPTNYYKYTIDITKLENNNTSFSTHRMEDYYNVELPNLENDSVNNMENKIYLIQPPALLSSNNNIIRHKNNMPLNNLLHTSNETNTVRATIIDQIKSIREKIKPSVNSKYHYWKSLKIKHKTVPKKQLRINKKKISKASTNIVNFLYRINNTNNDKYIIRQKFHLMDYYRNMFTKLLSMFHNKDIEKRKNVADFKNNNKQLTGKISREGHKFTIGSFCEILGTCKLNRGKTNLIHMKLATLYEDISDIVNTVKTIKRSLKDIDLTGLRQISIDKTDLNPNSEQVTDNIQIPNDILRNDQLDQISQLRLKTRVFVDKIAKFSVQLKELQRLLITDINRDRKILRRRILRNTKYQGKAMKKLEARRDNQKRQPIQKLKLLLLKYNLLQNTFISKMYKILNDIGSTKNSSAEEKKQKEKILYEKGLKMINNLRVLKEIADKVKLSKIRRKREVSREDTTIDYLLILLEYIVKQTMDDSAGDDPIDILIEAIKNAPDIKPIDKKVYEYTTIRNYEYSTTDNSEIDKNYRRKNGSILQDVYIATNKALDESITEDLEDFDKQQFDRDLTTSKNISTLDAVGEFKAGITVNYDILNNNYDNGSKLEDFSVTPEYEATVSGDIPTTTIKNQEPSEFNVNNISLQLPQELTVIGNSKMRYFNVQEKSSNMDDDNRVQLSWTERFDGAVTDDYESDTKKGSGTTTSKMEHISSINKNIDDTNVADKQSKSEAEELMYKKQIDLLNSLDYSVTEGLDVGVDNKNINDFYFV